VLAARAAQARATALDACGRHDEAERELAPYSAEELAEAAGDVDEEDDVVVYDLLDDTVEGEQVDAPEGEGPPPAADVDGPGHEA